MIEREISKEKYIFAGLIVIGIFFLGFLLGFVIDMKRAEYIQKEGRINSLDFNSLQLQYAYIDQLSQEKNCDAVSKTFDSNINQLEAARIKLENYDQNSKINKEDFQMLKREYIQAQIKYWLLSKKRSEICTNDTVVNLLYFFTDSEECPECDNQAFVLTYLKLKFKNKLLNFVFDEKIKDEPMIDILKGTYSINKFPAIIIDGKRFEGFTSKETLLKELCIYYGNETEECANIEP